ncbi:MAG: M23 family metallopeptidase [Deltaproteobacteria bacterium]|nr:M23 family metallopeptidase [Deltaproteobacteria bacterium]
MLTAQPQPTEAPPEQEGAPQQIRRDVIIAGLVLGLVAGAIVCYFAMSGSAAQTSAKTHEVSAASWLGGNADSGVQTASATAPSTADQLPETPTQYAPTPEESTAPIEPVVVDEKPEEEAAKRQVIKQGTVQKGKAVIKSLTHLDLSVADAHAIITALDGIFDFRKARPGQSFEVHVDSDTKKPTYFRYDVSITEAYEVKRKRDGLVGARKHIPTQKRERRFGGTIASSLFKALSEQDAHPTLAGKIVEVLAHEVDFYKAQRPGDTFRVIVEEESLDGTFIAYGPVLALEYNGTKSGKKRFFRFKAGRDDPTYFDEKGISVPRSVISIPLHYTRITSPFGRRYHPILKRRKLHNGVDFSAPRGTHVWACQAGKVTISSRKGANGNLVAINHEEGLTSFYAHLQGFAPGIKPGVKVRERRTIGYVGSTGRSTGPHLHFGLKRNGRFIDPLKYKVRPGRPAPPRYRSKLKAIIAERGRLLDKTRIRPPAAPLSEAPKDEEVLGLEDF